MIFRLRGIEKRSGNVDDCADGFTNIYVAMWKNKLTPPVPIPDEEKKIT